MRGTEQLNSTDLQAMFCPGQGWPAVVSRRAPRKERQNPPEVNALSPVRRSLPRQDGIPPSSHLRLRWRRDRPEQSTQKAERNFGLRTVLGTATAATGCQGSWAGATSGAQPSYKGGLRGGRVPSVSSRFVALTLCASLSAARHRCRARQAMQRHTHVSASGIPKNV